MRRSDAAKLFRRKNAEWVEATTPSFLPVCCERLVIGSINRHARARLDEIAFQETDDKVANGHTIVWQVRKYSAAFGFIRAIFGRLLVLFLGKK